MNIVLSILSAIILILIILPLKLGMLAWIALVPLFISLNRIKKANTAFFMGLCVGIITYSGWFYWLLTYKIWVFLVIVAIFSLFIGMFCYFTKLIWSRSPNPYFLILFPPFFWITLQYLYDIIPTGLGGFWANLGYSQIDYLKFLQVIDITGIPFITFLIIGINASICFTILPYFRPTAIKSGVVFLGLIGLIYGYNLSLPTTIQKTKEIKTTCIQANFYQSWPWRKTHVDEILATYTKLTRQAKKRFNPDFILWAEYAIPTDLLHNPTYYEKLSKLAKEVNSYIVLGSFTCEKKRVYNIVLVFSDKGELVSKVGEHSIIHRKILPVPFGETHISSGYDYLPFDTKFGKVGIIICYEDTFPQIATRMCKAGAQYLFFLANDGCFRNTDEPGFHAMMSTFRAIENRRFVVRVANTGITKTIDPFGKPVKGTIYYPDKDIIFKDIETTQNTRQIFLTSIIPRSNLTIYTKFGDIFTLFSLIVTIGMLFLVINFRFWILDFGLKKSKIENLSEGGTKC
ncbi:MAG: nitrilase-related carbon-nitrogen hydrolase [bacterium]|nr:nitrilase-related carbon-nitrogen hydrolase [bacterium]